MAIPWDEVDDLVVEMKAQGHECDVAPCPSCGDAWVIGVPECDPEWLASRPAGFDLAAHMRTLIGGICVDCRGDGEAGMSMHLVDDDGFPVPAAMPNRAERRLAARRARRRG